MSIFKNISPQSAKILMSLTKSGTQTRHSSVESSKRFQKLKAMQARMQCDDGVPVYLKKGTPDKMLFYLSNVLIVVGIISSLRMIWRHAKFNKE